MKNSNKTILILILILLILQFTFTTLVSANDVKHISNNSQIIEKSNEELYKDFFITLLQPYTQKAVDDYYTNYLKSIPLVDPWYVKLLSIERSVTPSFTFVIKLEVAPYIGPHNPVGIDHITFNVNNRGDVKLETFEHIKSYEIQPGYQIEIKTWPPK